MEQKPLFIVKQEESITRLAGISQFKALGLKKDVAKPEVKGHTSPSTSLPETN